MKQFLPAVLLAAVVAFVVTTAVVGAVSDSEGWTFAAAGVGLAATVVVVAMLLGSQQGWENGRRISLAAAAVVVVGLGPIALAAVIYGGGASDEGPPGTSAVADTGAPAADTNVGDALAGQVSNNEVVPPGYAHDPGAHPTFNEFMTQDTATILSNVPGGALTPPEVGLLKDQLAQVRAFAESHRTTEAARAAGYENTTNDVPFMGAHFLNFEYVADGVFDPSKPEGLLFSKLGNPDGDWQLVGVWFLIIPGLNPGVTDTIPTAGFAGNLDLWHAHHGLCTRQGIISENNTAGGCAADNGNWIGDLRWMMHTWVWPEGADNSQGVFTYLNQNLFDMQQARAQ